MGLVQINLLEMRKHILHHYFAMFYIAGLVMDYSFSVIIMPPTSFVKKHRVYLNILRILGILPFLKISESDTRSQLQKSRIMEALFCILTALLMAGAIIVTYWLLRYFWVVFIQSKFFYYFSAFTLKVVATHQS
jgi:hypothetical protein